MRENVFPEGEFDDLSRSELLGAAKLGSVDWKASPRSVLEEVDRLLSKYGLEVTLFQQFDDDVDFAILPRGSAFTPALCTPTENKG